MKYRTFVVKFLEYKKKQRKFYGEVVKMIFLMKLTL